MFSTGFSPRIFTKIMTSAFPELRKMGHCNTAYIDDSLLISESYADCTTNIQDTVELLDNLGITIHQDKSILSQFKRYNIKVLF